MNNNNKSRKNKAETVTKRMDKKANGNKEASTTKSNHDKTMDNLIAIKNNYPLTRDLTPSQIKELNKADVKFLMIDWCYPDKSII